MKALNQLEWSRRLFPKNVTESWHDMKIQFAFTFHPSFYSLDDGIGVDPGKNWGIGIAQTGYLTVCWGTFPKMRKDFEYLNYIRSFIIEWFPEIPAKICMIEGPSYGSLFKQPMLEDVRAGFMLGFKTIGKLVDYVPPQSARKQVFGNGRIKASEMWLGINPNAADAGALALYAGGYKHEEE